MVEALFWLWPTRELALFCVFSISHHQQHGVVSRNLKARGEGYVRQCPCHILFRIWDISGIWYITVHINCCVTSFQFFCVEIAQRTGASCLSWGSICEASTWEHLLPAISKEGEECGVAMVTKILPDPPAARELALLLNPLTLTTLGKSLLGCLWPRFWFLYCVSQSDNFSTKYWTRLPRAG